VLIFRTPLHKALIISKIFAQVFEKGGLKVE